MWFTISKAGSVAMEIDRADSNGNITTLSPLPGLPWDAVTSMAAGNAQETWIGASNDADGSYAGGQIFVADKRGGIRIVGTLSAPVYSLVNDPLGRGMWFGTTSEVGLITPTGRITRYAVPGAKGSSTPVRFYLGPDGKFWIPYALRQWLLMKFDTAGHFSRIVPLKATTSEVPVLEQVAQDRQGNAYLPDTFGNGLIRIDPAGVPSEYTTYANAIAGEASAVAGVVAGKDGYIYLLDVAVKDRGFYNAGGLVKIDPAIWMTAPARRQARIFR
jgi:hypothetical protein